MMLPKQDLWQALAAESRPILLYGMGNGADKIIATLAEYGVEIADTFASDGFVRGHSFHGKTVLSFSQAKERYTDFVTLLSFGSARPEVLAQIRTVAAQTTLYIPDVPVVGAQRFTLPFATAHRDELEAARAALADADSRAMLDRMVSYKLTGQADLLWEGCTTAEQDFATLLHPERYRACADLGAYNGDTASELLAVAPQIERIYAMEPAKRNYEKLLARAEGEGWADRLYAYQAAAWECDTTLQFRDEGNRNAGVGSTVSAAGGRVRSVDARALDSVLADARVDYIKYDVEGAERAALLGSRRTIAAHRPTLCVSVYHRSEDLFDLVLLVQQLCPDYRLYLRRRLSVPAWDLNLYAVPKE